MDCPFHTGLLVPDFAGWLRSSCLTFSPSSMAHTAVTPGCADVFTHEQKRSRRGIPNQIDRIARLPFSGLYLHLHQIHLEINVQSKIKNVNSKQHFANMHILLKRNSEMEDSCLG